MKLNALIYTSIMAALICVLAPWTIPVGVIPVTLCTFAIYVVASIRNCRTGSIAVLLYIALGAVGMPVFAGFAGGVEVIFGATGGFILGYMPCALIIGLLTDKYPNSTIIYPISMVLGTISCYAVGIIWFMWQADTTAAYAFSVCVLPFIITDIAKILLASIIAKKLRVRLNDIASRHR